MIELPKSIFYLQAAEFHCRKVKFKLNFFQTVHSPKKFLLEAVEQMKANEV